MAELSIKITSDGFDKAKTGLKGVSDALDTLDAKLSSINSKGVDNLNKGVERAGDNIRYATDGMKHFSEANKSLSAKIKERGRSLDYMGSKLLPFSIALGGLMTATLKAGMSFESAFAGVEKTVDAPRFVIAQLRDDFIDLSKKIPLATNELAKIGEMGGQLGIPEQNLMKFTEVVAKLGVSTNMTTDEISMMTAQFMNVMKVDFDNIDRLGSTLVELGNNLPTTESDIMSMAQRFSSVASTMDISAQSTLGWSGALSSLGILAEEGGSALGRTMIKFNEHVSSGGESLKQLSEISGMTNKEFSKLWSKDKSKATQSVIKGLSEYKKEGKDLLPILKELGISNTRDRNTVLKLANGYDVVKKSISMANDEWNRNKALEIEAQKRFGTTESKLQLLKNQLKATAIQIFDSLKPALEDTIESFINMTKGVGDFISKMNPNVLKEIVRGMLVFVGLAPALKLTNIALQLAGGAIGMFEKSGKALKGSALLGGLKETAGRAIKTSNTFRTLSPALAGLTGAIGPASIAVAGLYLVWKTMNAELDKGLDIIGNVTDGLGNTKFGVSDEAVQQ